ncbi:MAG: alpha-D-ribose 1-methylphosphonate 5-triphosphate diphosphatase [Sneathiella sp.]|nr:alpha-D-ribose 1-methylphosphonate 5-triphosphate diphosphatase [Sneathiella sp.]
MAEQIFTNARIILADQVIAGCLRLKDGIIADIDEGPSGAASAVDLAGDYLMPGFVELHTDNLEKHMTPRPKAEWPPVSAVIAHDGQMALNGITTVLDAMGLGDVNQGSARIERLNDMIKGIGDAREKKLLRSDHYLHLRCEVSYPDLPTVLDRQIGNPYIRMLSVMDHTPGQRQFVSLDAYYTYYQGKYGLSDGEMEAFIASRKQDHARHSHAHRKMVVELARLHSIVLASHDDATIDHVAEAVEDGIVVAEFPTTVEAAKASHNAGLQVLMGGPNIVRGKSHSGNVSARELARLGYLDVISSDYVPHSLLFSALHLVGEVNDISLPHAIRLISKTPAESIGLTDRGEIAVGKRADLVHVHPTPDHPVIRGVWSEGRRVA